MIQIEKNKIVPENPNLRVLSPSGDYADNDYILCSTVDNPDFALCAFSASFIKYGSIVNQFNDPLELGEALIKIDPDCKHDTAILFKEEETRKFKREKGDFTPENPTPYNENLNASTLENAVEGADQKEENIQDQIEKAKDNIKKLDEEAELSNNTSITTPPTSTDTSTATSTTTTPVIEPPVIDTSTSTPIIDNSTATTSSSTSTEPIIETELPIIEPEVIIPTSTTTEPLSILRTKNRRNIA